MFGRDVILLSLWGLSALDLAVVAFYFAAILGIALWVAKWSDSREGYFMAGRRFGKLVQTFAAFGQATSVEHVTTTTTIVNANGASGILAVLAGGLINLPLFWMTSPWYRRLRLLTLGDFFEERYSSRRMAAFYALCQCIYFVFIAAIGLLAMSKTIAAITVKPESALTVVERVEYGQALERETLEAADFSQLTTAQQARLSELQVLNPKKEHSYVSREALIYVVAGVTLVYASIGGVAAAFLVDLLQGAFILLLSVLLIPFAMAKINALHGTTGALGAFEVMHRSLPASFLEIWGSPALIEFTWYWILSFSVMVVVTTAVQANQMTACGTAKDDYTARYGFVAGVLLKRYSTVMWGGVALLTLVLYGGSVSDPDYVWGHATRDLLGPLGIGAVGLMLASLIAALMSSMSAFMLTGAALVTNNVFKPMFPDRSETYYVNAGRLFGLLYIAVSAHYATQATGIFSLYKLTMMFNCIPAAAFWLGMVWRRANAVGAWVSMGVMFVATVVLPFVLPLVPGVRSSEYLLKTTHATRVVRTYAATETDVRQRAEAIARWDAAAPDDRPAIVRPVPLTTGERFEKEVLLPKKSIFWSDELEQSGGVVSGRGYLKVELVALDWLGWDLSRNSYSLNETLTFLFRTILPFLVVMLCSRFGRPDEGAQLDQFFGKMLTPVVGSAANDVREMELTRADPHRLDHLKIWPASNWEFRRWDREDWVGVVGSCVAAASVVALLVGLVSLGG
jgi:SSS family solute:Na+ symporter